MDEPCSSEPEGHHDTCVKGIITVCIFVPELEEVETNPLI
jgi:hypothetical protein